MQILPTGLSSGYESEESDSGERVSEDNSISIAAYWAGVRLITEAIASLPIHVYRARPTRGKDRITTHPVSELLRYEPNPRMTAFTFREVMCYHAINWGNGYAEIVRRGDGLPGQLWPLPPNQTKPETIDGVFGYTFTMLDGTKVRLASDDVIHVPGLSFDGIQGYSVIQIARQDLGLTKAQDKYGSKFFKNGAHVRGTLNTDVALDEKSYDRLEKSWNKKYTGLDDAHRTAILDNGLKFTAIGMPNTDAQWLESRTFQIQQIARWLNIPPHKLRELSNATFSNIEHQNIEWVTDTLRPWLVRFEQEYRRKLFRDKSLFIEHDLNGLLRGDAATRKELYQSGRQWGWLSANDVRELEGYNPLPMAISTSRHPIWSTLQG